MTRSIVNHWDFNTECVEIRTQNMEETQNELNAFGQIEGQTEMLPRFVG